MKLLSSFLVATYANTVADETQCHEIDGLDQKYRKFADQMPDVIGKHTTLEFVPADSGADLDDDGVPLCVPECDADEDCLFAVHTTDECGLGKVKSDQTHIIFNR